MTSQEQSKQEYIARINGIMEYIEQHIDQPINLYAMAQIAHFSPFHFHRIFTVMVGETPANFLQRGRPKDCDREVENHFEISCIVPTEVTVRQIGYTILFLLFSAKFRL